MAIPKACKTQVFLHASSVPPGRSVPNDFHKFQNIRDVPEHVGSELLKSSGI
jgi:hypothetical protein